MRPLTAVCTFRAGTLFLPALRRLLASEMIEEVLVVTREQIPEVLPRCSIVDAGPLTSGAALQEVLEKTKTEYLLLIPGTIPVLPGSHTLERMIGAIQSMNAALVYSDYYEDTGSEKRLHPLIDYQAGSVRDDFDFGHLVLFSVPRMRQALKRYGGTPPCHHGALYDLRLKLSVDHRIHHVQEALYSIITHGQERNGMAHFSYLDPHNHEIQKEMESIFTGHLKRIGAYIPPDRLELIEEPADGFPVKASVIIPVKNRKATIADAVQSALAQEADFTFNIIVIDNHSTDGTTGVVAGLAEKNPAVRHIIPDRHDLGIGGCWNLGINDRACGRYAVQLDSDDLYENNLVLETIVDTLRDGNFAMVVGSYTIVNENLDQIPPGLIDHREWTDTNGHNNALRINGLGAPRAFSTTLMRQMGFLNVSYGEDYAAALSISRRYKIGRVFESLYLCRRWTGNTDAGLSIEASNTNNTFKDSLRSQEIAKRQELGRNG
jgi:hypothetical protein